MTKMKRTGADVTAKIKAARDEARVKAHGYMNLTIKHYDYWRAVSSVMAYDESLEMFARATEHKIPDMAVEAVVNFERARDGETTEMTLAFADGRRDALASVADWIASEEETE